MQVYVRKNEGTELVGDKWQVKKPYAVAEYVDLAPILKDGYVSSNYSRFPGYNFWQFQLTRFMSYTGRVLMRKYNRNAVKREGVVVTLQYGILTHTREFTGPDGRWDDGFLSEVFGQEIPP